MSLYWAYTKHASGQQSHGQWGAPQLSTVFIRSTHLLYPKHMHLAVSSPILLRRQRHATLCQLLPPSFLSSCKCLWNVLTSQDYTDYHKCMCVMYSPLKTTHAVMATHVYTRYTRVTLSSCWSSQSLPSNCKNNQSDDKFNTRHEKPSQHITLSNFFADADIIRGDYHWTDQCYWKATCFRAEGNNHRLDYQRLADA